LILTEVIYLIHYYLSILWLNVYALIYDGSESNDQIVVLIVILYKYYIYN